MTATLQAAAAFLIVAVCVGTVGSFLWEIAHTPDAGGDEHADSDNWGV